MFKCKNVKRQPNNLDLTNESELLDYIYHPIIDKISGILIYKYTFRDNFRDSSLYFLYGHVFWLICLFIIYS